MKVLEINVVCGIRSTGRICTDLADILYNEGHQCCIAYGRGSIPSKYKDFAFRIGNDIDVRYHFLKSFLFDECGFNSKNVTKRLVKKIEEYDPDIIHLHNLHGYYINIEILFEYLKICGRKIIWTLHDCWAFTGHCSHYTAIGCEKWKQECFQCPQKKEYPVCILRENVNENYKRKKQLFTQIPNLTLVTPSNWLAKQVKQSFLSDYSVVVIPNGIDLEKFRHVKSDFRSLYHLENKKIVLGVATAWGPRKGYQEFCRLAEILPSNYKVVLVGLNKKQLRNLPNNILGVSQTNDTIELAQMYSAADVFLNAGKEETMGMTTVEAMACGTPVVVSNLSAIPEVVDDNSGIIVNTLSDDVMVDAIERVVNGNYCGMLNNAARFEKKKQYQQYIELYKK